MEREFRNLKYSLPLYIDEVLTRAFSLADLLGKNNLERENGKKLTRSPKRGA
jgi:hypothetical protein